VIEMNVRFHNALKGIAQPTPPIWFMRQAGRYHSHYQKMRQAHSFMDLCKNPKLAAEVALGPIQDFDFDVAILFSDLLFPLEALGMGLKYDPAPELGFRLTADTLKKLRPLGAALDDLHFQQEALEETRRVLPADKSLIGFVGGPWTLFSYAIEGEHKGNLIAAKSSLPLFEAFCERLMPLLEANIELQLAGGAEVVMLFDTAAGELTPRIFRHLVQKHLLQLAHRFPDRLAYYSKGTTADHLVDLRRETSLVGFGFDHRFDLPALLKTNAHGFVQGNFDQSLLFAAPGEFEKLLRDYLTEFLTLSRAQRRHWVCGLGHGVLPATPEANVRTFIKTVREVFA
jgi:uroporphyrinogen decarboxylase